MENKIELLNEIIGASKEFDFPFSGVLYIRKYYDTKKNINVNFIALMEIMKEKLSDEDINKILLTNEEIVLGDE